MMSRKRPSTTPRVHAHALTEKKAARTAQAEQADVTHGESTGTDGLFARIATILDKARSSTVRAINSSMVLAYWLIGREIVEEMQRGQERAGYGEMLIETLSEQLNKKYGRGYSAPNLRMFRQFYQTYQDRRPTIDHPMEAQFPEEPIRYPAGIKLPSPKLLPAKRASREGYGSERGLVFSPQLSWSHYRALMRVSNSEARDFYEQEAILGGWDKRTLERQIQTQYFERCLHSQRPKEIIADGRHLQKEALDASEVLKNPYVLEFLGYPNFAELRELDIEKAILGHLQRFLLELGNGFAFVARQKYIRIEEQERYIDLVFYHCRLKFYLLIDLKIGELTHADVGQMDGYVRMFDDMHTTPGDNPTIGLILCNEKNETVARYSVLNDRKQLFASKYMLCLPTEKQLQLEIDRERRLIEAVREEFGDYGKVRLGNE